MLWWDGPSLGGLYGFAEPAIYREPRMESYTVSRWKKVLSRGTVRGKVYGKAGAVAGAIVQAYDGKTTFTGTDGSYSLHDVPLGGYLLKSSKVIDGVLYSAQININLNVADLVADIHLQPPSDRYRLAQIFINYWGRDYEGTSEDNDDLDGQGGLTFQIGVGQTSGATLTITNTDEDDDDAGVLTISLKNVRNTNESCIR